MNAMSGGCDNTSDRPLMPSLVTRVWWPDGGEERAHELGGVLVVFDDQHVEQ